MNRFLFSLFFLLLLITLVPAETQTLGTFIQGKNISLIQTCASCTYNNITTIKNANGTLLTFNVAMTKDGSFFNYTLNSQYTKSLGEYIVNGVGDLDGVPTVWNYNFFVTPSGTLLTNAESIPLFLPMVLMLLLMFLGFFVASMVDKKEYKWVFIMLGGFFLIMSIAFGIIASREVLWGFPLLYNFVNSFYNIFIVVASYGSIGIAIIVMFFIIQRVFEAKGYIIRK